MSPRANLKAAQELADLARVIDVLAPDQWQGAAQLLGFDLAAPSLFDPSDEAPPSQTAPLDATLTTPETAVQTALVVPMWRAVSIDVYEDNRAMPSSSTLPADPSRPPFTRAELRAQRGKQPAKRPIQPWSRLWPRLAQQLVSQRRSRALDTDAAVRLVARGLPLRRLPRRQRRAWADKVVLLVDRDEPQRWLFGDQDWLIHKLAATIGFPSIELRVLEHGPDGVPFDPRSRRYTPWVQRAQRTALLLLGSMSDGGHTAQAWMELGRRLRARGYRVAALAARPLCRVDERLRQQWEVMGWERRGGVGMGCARPASSILRRRADALLTLCAPAMVVSPTLLRALRGLLSKEGADVGTEADVWGHGDVERTVYGLRFLPAKAAHWQMAFDRCDEDDEGLRVAALRLIFEHQQPHGQEVNHMSVLRLMHSGSRSLVAAEVAAAVGFADRLGPSMSVRTDEPDFRGDLRRWFRNHCGALPGMVYAHSGAGRGLSEAWRAAHGDEDVAPAGLDPRSRPSDVDLPMRALTVTQGRAGFELGGRGSPVATLLLRSPDLTLVADGQAYHHHAGRRISGPKPNELRILSDSCELTLRRFTKPSWASAIERDAWGLVATCRLNGVPLRMRWMPPGRFMMGSPPNEPGRYEDEGPQHEVVLTRGFWLAETPCTQEQWEAVMGMGRNPSRFKSPTRPVEGVHFHAVRGFINKLNTLSSDILFRLPSEAEWEYACRAGTTEATYVGPIEIVGENHAPVLHDIAWYGGNSGEDFDLDNGYDSSAWPEKQFEHNRAGTRPVAQKLRNPWGLYDMLGNVWEWCEDGAEDEGAPFPYQAARDSDPLKRSDTQKARVVRGGSWNDRARDVRAAYRNADPPADAYGYLGFRISRGQELPGPESGDPTEGRAGGASYSAGRGTRAAHHFGGTPK